MVYGRRRKYSSKRKFKSRGRKFAPSVKRRNFGGRKQSANQRRSSQGIWSASRIKNLLNKMPQTTLNNIKAAKEIAYYKALAEGKETKK